LTAGARPSENELEVERRAIAVAVGRIRVAIYEETGGKPSNMKTKHRSCLVAPR
jgi:hypothetical protein